MKKTVVFGFLGPQIDQGGGAERWRKWRPTVGLCQQQDLVVHRFELFTQDRYKALADTVVGDIASISPETTVVRRMMELANPWDFEEVYAALHDFARGYPFDPDAEEYLVHITTGTHVAQICLFLLTESRHVPGRLVQTSPSPRAPQHPGTYSIVDLDLSKYDRLASRFVAEKRDAVSLLKSGIETRNERFNRLIERIEQVAIHSREPLLLTGPTGAGKSRLARRIFELRKSRHQLEGNFVEVNCATIRGEGAMSALFGHVKGSFTGAMRDRPGLLRAAHRGVLFLDEIGELALDEQAMLLRAVEEKTFFPLGSDREVKSDFLLIAGTNRDLAAMVRDGRFRDDLLARINLWSFELPGLRERPEDIEPNVMFELEQWAQRHGARVTFNKEARERFLRFATSPNATWTANFRDLGGAIVRMATLARGGRITIDVVDEEIERLRERWSDATSRPTLFPDLEIDPFDRVQLEYVVEVARRSRSMSDAGRELFASSRAKRKSVNDADRLRKYLASFGLSWEMVRNAGVLAG